jgi:hypothetical protein
VAGARSSVTGGVAAPVPEATATAQLESRAAARETNNLNKKKYWTSQLDIKSL